MFSSLRSLESTDPQRRPIQTNPLLSLDVILHNVIAWPPAKVQAYICTSEPARDSLSFASHLFYVSEL